MRGACLEGLESSQGGEEQVTSWDTSISFPSIKLTWEEDRNKILG